ncbi:hypothetical protein OB13_02155 [Pontibacter sp. HJ8]
MKLTFRFAMASAGLLLVLSACSVEKEDVAPQLRADELQVAVQGKWSIERINSKLCRSGNCNTQVYNGRPQDYFELRADSAFLLRSGTQYANTYRDRFKADYSYAGSFVLSNFSWSARYVVKLREANKLVLESTFTGTDPNAVFTDTYFLYQ